MVLHVGLSFIVLQAVVQKKFRYVVYAILIHGTVNALAGIISLYVPGKSGIIMSEVSIAIFALLTFSYSFILKKGCIKMRRMLLIIISAIAAFALAACTGNKVDESTSKSLFQRRKKLYHY